MNPDSSPLSEAITKAIAYTENGGKLDIHNPKAGKSGELKSIFQFKPDTWKQYAKEVLGDENAPITPDAEAFVVNKKVHKWLQEGKDVHQIASIWNAGGGEPDAYSGKFSNGQPSTGVNKKGIKFDVKGYANKVSNYTKEFLVEKSHKQINDPASKLMGIMREAQQKAFAPTQQPGSVVPQEQTPNPTT